MCLRTEELSSTESALSDSRSVEENISVIGRLEDKQFPVHATLGYRYPRDIQSGMAKEYIIDNRIENEQMLT